MSHAHSDHIGAHAEVIASHGTAKLMRERLAGERVEHLLGLGETRKIFGLPVTLLAAGHIFGSAQFYTEADAGSLLYTGDFKLRSGLSAERAQWRFGGNAHHGDHLWSAEISIPAHGGGDATDGRLLPGSVGGG
ncbi:MAG: hypothetical protein QM796_10150 [Chthoniobacteraceae bacterium]